MEEFKRVEANLNEVVNAVERSDALVGNYKASLDMYVVVYNAATRSSVSAIEGQNAAAEALYVRYGELLSDVVVRPLDVDNLKDPQKVFEAVIRKWAQYKRIYQWMIKSFRYLSRYYIPQTNVAPLDTVALKAFYILFQQHSSVIGKQLLNLFRAERRGEFVNKDNMRFAVEMFNQMSTVENGTELQLRDFTEPFLKDTRAYYKAEAAEWIANSSATAFLERADKCIREEQERAQRLLPEAMQEVLILNVEQQVLANHLHNIINMPQTGFAAMLRDWRVEEIGRAVSLISRLKQPGLEPMATVVKELCRQEGAAVAKRYSTPGDTPDFKGYTSDFIALHEKYTKLLGEQLQGAGCFQNAIKDAFEATLNNGITIGEPPAPVSCSELLASYCDYLLRSGAEMSDEETEETFGKVVSLFLRVVDRDTFQEFLRKMLSRRLLTNANVSEEREKSLVAKFKAKCGASFTCRLEGMINDRNVSLDMCKDFSDSEAGKHCPFDFSAQVLTMGFWPTFAEDKAVVPLPVQSMITKFSEFYLAKGKNKRLQWVHSLGSATITAAFRRGNKELIMAVYQAIVLMLFTDVDSLTIQQIVDRSGLELDEVKRVVHSFCHQRVRVLLRANDGAPLNPGDAISVNLEFSSAQKKIKLPLAVQRSAAQAAAVHQAVEEDRRPAVDACIVRIMKSRKQMEHALLVAAVIEVLQSRFKPEPKLIKLRIEDLINREYLERAADKPNTYTYLA